MFDSLSKTIESIDIKWKIGGLVGLAAIVGGATYYFLKKPQETIKTKPSPLVLQRKTSRIDRRPEPEDENPEKALIRVLNKIKKTFREQGVVTYETVKAIYLGQYELSRKEFAQLATRHRLERRKVVSNIDKYIQLSKQYDENLQELHNKHLNAILAYFRIDKEAWMGIIEEISANNKDEWQSLLNEAEREEIISLRSRDKPKIRCDILIEIYKFKAKYVKQKFDFYKNIPDMDTADLLSLVEKQIQDKVYEQFKVEEEDIKFSEQHLSEEEREGLERYEEDYVDIFRELVLDVGDEGSQEIDGRDEDS